MAALTLTQTQNWRYETDEFDGVCEIAKDAMTIKCVFECTSNVFQDVLLIDAVIRDRLQTPISVERLAEQLAGAFPEMRVTVSGRAKTHGWITSGVCRPYV